MSEKNNMVATVPMENMKMDMKISMEMDMSEVRPQGSLSLCRHFCGAGCTLADITEKGLHTGYLCR